MPRVFNFGAGPAMLAEEVIERAREELLDFRGSGMSILELSHRGPEFTEVIAQAELDFRDLLHIPDNYHVLFLQGGATSQFAMVPLNLKGAKANADYVCSGHWSQKAIVEASKHINVNVVADTARENFNCLPHQNTWKMSNDAAYVHYTPNETIAGVEFNWVPQVNDVPLVADMSSNILSRPIDISQFGLIYAGAQKNIGPAGLVIVIMRDDLVGSASVGLPTMMDYRTHVIEKSMYNTPAVFAIYVAGLTFQWLKRQGGVERMEQQNISKARMLYEYLDQSDLYVCPVATPDRSRMNVRFHLRDASLEESFLQEASIRGLMQLKGHRLTGGLRASLYNAMPLEGVQALVAFLTEFESSQATRQ